MNCVEALGTVLSQYNAHEMDKSSMFHQAVLFFRVSAVRDRKEERKREGKKNGERRQKEMAKCCPRCDC
jgi:hypothetical protein